MPYGDFLAAVRERGGYDREETVKITEAVVAALGRRLTGASAGHLADQLPLPLAEILRAEPGGAESWGVEEFLTHVAQATGAEREAVEDQARTVLATLGERISGGELNKLLGQLPSSYAALFGHPELTN